jgi:hypothetical protein
LAFTLVAATASYSQAQPKLEVGASLASAIVGTGDNGGSTFGIPSAGFGLINPGAYASVFVGSHFAVEPQIGFMWFSGDGDSGHFLNFTGQADYFVSGISQPSPFVFVAAGVVSISGAGTTPKTVGAGAGYRIRVGDRLVFRLDGRFTHVTENAGDQVTFTLSIGGVFGK